MFRVQTITTGRRLAQLVEHRTAVREVQTSAGPTLRVFPFYIHNTSPCTLIYVLELVGSSNQHQWIAK